MKIKLLSRLAITSALLLTSIHQPLLAQSKIGAYERDRGKTILKLIKDDVKKYYYDTNYHGIDLETRFKTAEEKIGQATSNNQINRIIAQVLLDFNDSHTFFNPPQHSARIEYGWRMQMIGERCFVTAIKPGSDAETKGIKVGDQIISIDSYRPEREIMWKLEYLYYSLDPHPAVRLVVESPDGKQRQADVIAKVDEGMNMLDLSRGMSVRGLHTGDDQRDVHRYAELKEGIFIWKMPEFNLTAEQVDKIMDKASKSKTLILDLRGNPGGAEVTLLRLIGNLFDHDVTIGTLKRRKDTQSMIAKSRGERAFKGKMIVLVDSGSASCSEILARVVQLEKRGSVIGDESAGAVMGSRHYSHKVGTEIVIFFGTSITEQDLIMSDGKSLEQIGVKPDELVLPTGSQLATKIDPILTRALAIGGLEVKPENTGALFPVEW